VNRYSKYQVNCVTCGSTTTKAYARLNSGLCKTCVTGESQERLFTCPDCGEKRLTAYQHQHGYHCDTCTRNVEQTGGIYGY
jgi:DNA-directed RNA polymerase subunit RPC12/RpoP